MAMTREEEKELRLNCSIGNLLSSIVNRPDLKMDPPSKDSDEEDDENSEGGKKKKKKIRIQDEEEERAVDYFLKDVPDFEEDDPDWVKEEKKSLVEMHGKRIVTVGFDERDRFVYICEICNVECNNRLMVDSHCLGMKHLRKKKLHDLKLEGKQVPITFKVSKSKTEKPSKPSGVFKSKEKAADNEDGPPKNKKRRWQQGNQSNYYGNYEQGPGNPPYGAPPNYAAVPPPFPPVGGPPPNFYGQWGPNPPPVFNTPPPNIDNSNKGNKNSLAGGDTGSLLQKLADCAVKNDKDSDLAINVVIALMKSLKDFNHKRGETKFIEVLTEADVTFRILKTLKPANKEGDNVPSPSLPSVREDQNTSSPACASEYNPAAPTSSHSGDYPTNQYYNSQNNSNAGYSYGGGSSNYSNPVPTGVPPPSATNYNSHNSSGYNAHDGSSDPNFNPNPAYQGPGSNNQGGYPHQNYSNSGYGNPGPNSQHSNGYYNQGQGNNQAPSYNQSSEEYFNKGSQNTPTPGEDSNQSQGSQKAGSGGSNKASGVLPPPPPPPPAPAVSDGNAPDFSNYGYAAGYSLGYYNVPPPTYSNTY